MNGEIAQTLSLVAYANAFLQGQDIVFDLEHKTAQFCKLIEFIEIPQGVDTLRERIVLAEEPQSWFELLRKQGVEKVVLHYLSSGCDEFPDRQSSAFVGGGGRWVIEAIKGDRSDLWEARWKTEGWENAHTSGFRIWEVYYILFAKDCNRLAYDYPMMDEVYNILKQTLIDITKFALRQECTAHFSEYYQHALEFLSSENPLEDLDWLPEGFLLRAQQLVRACYEGWVFGGMGSWNDLVYDDETRVRYNKVSDNLYIGICLALIVAVNSFSS